MLYDAFNFCYSFLLDRVWIFAAIAAWYVLCFSSDLLFNPYGRQNRQILRAKKELSNISRYSLPENVSLPQAYAQFIPVMKGAPDLCPSSYLAFKTKKPGVVKPLICLAFSAAILPCTAASALIGIYNYVFYLPLFFAVTFIAYIQTHFLCHLRRLLRAKKIHEEYLAALDEYFIRCHAVAPRPRFNSSQTSQLDSKISQPHTPSCRNLTPIARLRLTRLLESGLQRDAAQEVCDLLNKTDAKLATANDYATLNEYLNKALSAACKNKKVRTQH